MKLHNPFSERKHTLAGSIAESCVVILVAFMGLYAIYYVMSSFSPVVIAGTVIFSMLGYAVIYYVYYIFTGKDLFGKPKETNSVSDVD